MEPSKVNFLLLTCSVYLIELSQSNWSPKNSLSPRITPAICKLIRYRTCRWAKAIVPSTWPSQKENPPTSCHSGLHLINHVNCAQGYTWPNCIDHARPKGNRRNLIEKGKEFNFVQLPLSACSNGDVIKLKLH